MFCSDTVHQLIVHLVCSILNHEKMKHFYKGNILGSDMFFLHLNNITSAVASTCQLRLKQVILEFWLSLGYSLITLFFQLNKKQKKTNTICFHIVLFIFAKTPSLWDHFCLLLQSCEIWKKNRRFLLIFFFFSLMFI